MAQKRKSPYNIDKVKHAILMRGMMQDEIARAAGLTQGSISHFLHKRPVHGNTAMRIVKAVGLKMDDVLLASRKSA